MGIWSSTLFGSGGAIQWERWGGRLEVLVAAPVPFVLVLFSLTLASALVGVYSLAATLVWGRLLFGVPFTVAHWLPFCLAIPVTVLGLGMLGLLFAATFVLYRHANALSNMLEFPVLFVTGLLVPVATWGMRAIRDSALGGDPWPALGMTLALGVAYVALGSLCVPTSCGSRGSARRCR
jgi:ABC-2 type transport system permease protein